VIATLPPITKFTAAHFYRNIILKINEGLSFDLAQSDQQLILRISNATPIEPSNRLDV
jgi:hypothetical protein